MERAGIRACQTALAVFARFSRDPAPCTLVAAVTARETAGGMNAFCNLEHPRTGKRAELYREGETLSCPLAVESLSAPSREKLYD